MDLDFTPDQLEFRDQVRTWLDENKPAVPRPRDDAGIREDRKSTRLNSSH